MIVNTIHIRNLRTYKNLLQFSVICILMYFVAPVCFNTTYCDGESLSDDLLSFEQCCFELSAVSFAAPGQCLLCPITGSYMLLYMK